MKKFLALFLAFCMIATSMVFVPLTIAAEDANSAITVTSVEELNQAIKDISNGGTITVQGTIVVPAASAFTFSSGAKKTYTITGGSFDFSPLTDTGFVHIKDHITFESTNFNFDSSKNDYLFANGYNLTIKESVTFTGAKVCFYGGVLNAGCTSVNFTLLSGNYTHIYCSTNTSSATNVGSITAHIGGNVKSPDIIGNRGGCTISGDVSIRVDGNANIDSVYGGGTGGTINGNTNVTVAGNAVVVELYGGGTAGTVNGNTNVTVAGSADVKSIYGGGKGGTVKGNTYVTVKESANAAKCDPTDHDMTYKVFGGGVGGAVEGSTNVIFTGSAEANYIFGGCNENGTVGTATDATHTTNVTMAGGNVYGIYGGAYRVEQNCGANVTVKGGTVYQVFGGSEDTDLTGDVNVKLYGGTVKRRVFGGCYNEWSVFWESSAYVNGNITLFIGSNADLPLNSENDNALSAHSRRDSVASDEHGIIITAKSTYNGDLNTGDSIVGVDGPTHEIIHNHTYTKNGNTVTQACSCGNSATATITPNGTDYTGEAMEVGVAYSNNWEFEHFDITYANNVNAGEATATLTIDDGFTTLSYNYTINKIPNNNVPVINGAGDITTEMQYSVNGKDFYDVTDPNALSGRYFIRYNETPNYLASSATMIYTNVDLVANLVSGRKNDTVEVIVYTPGYTGEGFELTVSYDTTALTLTGATNGDILDVCVQNGNTLTLSGTSANAKKGTFVKLYFTVNEAAEIDKEYAISIIADGIRTQAGSITVVEQVIGDLSGNGVIDLSDIVALRKLIVSPSTNELADVNGDGEINSADVVLLRQYLASYDFDAGESTVILGNN